MIMMLFTVLLPSLVICRTCKRSFEDGLGHSSFMEECEEGEFCGITSIVRRPGHRLRSTQIHQGCVNARFCEGAYNQCKFICDTPGQSDNCPGWRGTIVCCCDTEYCNSRLSIMFQFVLRIRLAYEYSDVCPTLDYQSRALFDKTPKKWKVYELEDSIPLDEIFHKCYYYAAERFEKKTTIEHWRMFRECAFVSPVEGPVWSTTNIYTKVEIEERKREREKAEKRGITVEEDELTVHAVQDGEYLRFLQRARFVENPEEVAQELKLHMKQGAVERGHAKYQRKQLVFASTFVAIATFLATVAGVFKYIQQLEEQVKESAKVEHEAKQRLADLKNPKTKRSRQSQKTSNEVFELTDRPVFSKFLH